MEILAEQNLREWLLAFCLKYRKGKHREVDNENPHVNSAGIMGDQLLLSAVFPLYDLAKALLAHTGKCVSVEGGKSDLTPEETELFIAVRDRLGRVIAKMNNEEPGCWVINPKVEDLHVGVLPGHDPMEGPISAVRPTHTLLAIAEKTIPGTKWEQYLGDSAIYKDTQIGAGV